MCNLFSNLYFVESNIFVKIFLKLDEVEIVKGRKMERVIITLINRALDKSISNDDSTWFSFQSKNCIWPIVCFELKRINIIY